MGDIDMIRLALRDNKADGVKGKETLQFVFG